VKRPVGKKEPQTPRRRSATCPIPHEERKRKRVILRVPLSPSPFCLSSCVLPHCGVFPLFFFTGGLLAPFLLPLSPLLAAPAGHDDDEEEDHGGDAAPDGQHQEEDFGERGCGLRRREKKHKE